MNNVLELNQNEVSIVSGGRLMDPVYRQFAIIAAIQVKIPDDTNLFEAACIRLIEYHRVMALPRSKSAV